MTIAELTSKVEYLTDDAGQRKVVLDLPVWQELLRLLDEQRWDELFASPESQALLEDLAGEALAEHRQGKTKELIPERL